jgi:hypothetical protein
MKGRDGIDGKGILDVLFPDPMTKSMGVGALLAMGVLFVAWLVGYLVTHVL